MRIVSTVIDAHPELFAGSWWDGASGGYVFTTIDATQAAALLDQELPADVAYRLEIVARNASQLAATQDRASALAGHGLVVSAYPRVWDAIVEVDLAILDQPTVDAVREVFAGDLDAICVTGADPATLPPDGPQPTAGDGWRLLADQIGRGGAYSMHVAVDDAEYQSLWASLSLDGDRPPVDFADEIVIHFGASYGGNCPEIRLDGVDFDLARSMVTPDIVLLGGNRMCNADSNPHAYVVAVDKARLPPVPFTVGLDADCTSCVVADVTSLERTDSPRTAGLSDSDRWQILAAAAVSRVGINGTHDGRIEVVDVVARATTDGSIDFGGGNPLTASERDAITQALAPRNVQFVPPHPEDNIAIDGYVLLILAEPVVRNGQLTISTALACGSLCGNGGAYAVERGDDGTWTTTVPVGPQWEA